MSIILLFILFAQPIWAGVSIQKVQGRCVGCNPPFKLSQFQFVTPLEGWATGFYIVASGGHVSQSSVVLHTVNGGKTWMPVPDIETYGLDVEPVFSFINAQEGWIGWTTASEPMDHLIKTANGGHGWIRLAGSKPGLLAHLRFFDSHLGYAAISTMHGPQFGVTRDGGKTWSFRKELQDAGLLYPDVMHFLNPQVGWIGGTKEENSVLHPRLLRTANGGVSWQQGTFPKSAIGDPWDIFFLNSDHGWIVLGNANPTALFHTTDGGLTWSEDTSWAIQGYNLFPRAIRYLSDKIGLVFVSERQPEDANSVEGKSNSSVLVTTDAGLSWSRHELTSEIQSCDVAKGEVWCTSGMDILKIRVQP
jgi:photosystem II stability/assembly factor-like uncharacterized protein